MTTDPVPEARITSYTHDGLTFEVRDQGPIDGDVVVLLHGFPQTSTSWDRVAPLLHAAGFRTLAPDQRGYSPGARPPGRRAYALRRLVGDVAALVERVGGPVHVVGHDWGAAVAWAFAAEHPEHTRTLTSVSVPHPGAMIRSFATFDQLRRSWYMLFFQIPWLPERLMSRRRVSRHFLTHTGMPEAALRRYPAEMVAGGRLSGGMDWYRAMPLSDPHLLRARVRVPTTHVWSDGDTALGRRGADLCAAYVVGADYRLAVLPGVSHWIPDEAPERLATLILGRVSPDAL